MEQLTLSLEKLVTSSVEEFAKVLSKDFNLPYDEVIKRWSSSLVGKESSSPSSSSSGSSGSSTKSSKVPKRLSKAENGTCQYVFKKGKNSGQNCGTTPSALGAKYCKKHMGTDDKVQKKPVEKKIKNTTSLGEVTSPQIGENKPSLILRKNEYGNYEDTITHFVFNSKTKLVVGVQSGEKVRPLSDEDKELCKEKNFRYFEPEIPEDDSSKEHSEDEVKIEADSEVETDADEDVDADISSEEDVDGDEE